MAAGDFQINFFVLRFSNSEAFRGFSFGGGDETYGSFVLYLRSALIIFSKGPW